MQKDIIIAIPSFPGNNCEVESIRSLKRVGIKPLFFRWNDDRSKIKDVDGFFIPGGFSYEDRGRAGMIAGRDSLLDEIGRQAEEGKVVIGNCNGAQIVVESGLIPLGNGLKMCLAQNIVKNESVGFLNEWVWVKPVCPADRCATSNWSKPIHMPIAHGEGRFTTKDKDLLKELEDNNQLAFKYCNEKGEVSQDPIVTPNGSVYAVAGICNPAGNVVALMPHPERTLDGDPYFISLKRWIERKQDLSSLQAISYKLQAIKVEPAPSRNIEIFIDTIITNNEERTVETAVRRNIPNLSLKQLKYLSPDNKKPEELLTDFSLFNPNKEIAYIREGENVFIWNSDSKIAEKCINNPINGFMLLRINQPDTGAMAIGGGKTGICYVLSNVTKDEVINSCALTVFANPHSSTLYSFA